MMHIGIHSPSAQYFAIAMLLMFIVGFAMSAGPLVWVLCSEIQPLKGRDFGITCCHCHQLDCQHDRWRNVS